MNLIVPACSSATPARARAVRVDTIQPGLLPDRLTQRMAASMVRTITAHFFENYGVGHASQTGSVHEVVNLVDPFEHSELAFTAIRHLGHEGERIQTSVRIQCGENVAQRANPDALTDT